MSEKKYRLLKTYEDPGKIIEKGVVKTIPEWVKEFPVMWGEDFEKYPDWFAPINEPERTSYGLLQECLAFFDKDTTNVPKNLYKEVFNYLIRANPALYTQEQMNEARREAFEAGGLIGNVSLIRPTRSFSDSWTYQTFEDYLKTIQP